MCDNFFPRLGAYYAAGNDSCHRDFAPAFGFLNTVIKMFKIQIFIAFLQTRPGFNIADFGDFAIR